LPKFFDGFLTAFFHNNPWWGICFLGFFLVLFILREGFRYGNARANQTARKDLLKRLSRTGPEAPAGGRRDAD